MDRAAAVQPGEGPGTEEAFTKRCTKCGVDKPLTAYGKQKGGRYGLHPRCKACRQAAERARYWSKREEILAKQRARRQRKQETDRRRRRLIRYGVTQERYETMYRAQGGCCAICGDAFDVLCVDHDHETGDVRGLLCWPCNFGIGHLRDDPDRLVAAAQYLRSPPARYR